MIAALAALGVSIALLLVRFIMGPSIFDKILAANVIGTNIILVALFLGFYHDAKSYIDVALVYAFLNFIATIGFLRFFRYGFKR
jgi:multicomponent Na+:H+ antiporter subunit F